MSQTILDRLADEEFVTGQLPSEWNDDFAGANLGWDVFREKRGTSADQPMVQLVDEIVSEAIHLGASDIHFEPMEGRLRVRARVDGILRELRSIPEEQKAELVSRLKIMADLDIAEKRRPQDGRIRVQSGRRQIDLRVSALPADHGEKVVLRILDKGSLDLKLDSLGLRGEKQKQLLDAARRPWGMILVTGPTGSGKTTTLYSLIRAIQSPEKNITTVEDPIEYRLEGITQTAVKPEIDVTFAAALRSILRQDPNVILVGEIRDRETAEIAIRAALTGHLVLSTLHTNDAASAPGRLLDMGIEPFLVASALHLVVAQRLVRKLCPHCRQPSAQSGIVQPTDAGFAQDPWVANGCPNCSGTGYQGRTGIFELMELTKSIQDAILTRSDAATIRVLAKESGATDLRGDGLERIKNGETTWTEVLRETV